MNWNDCFLIRRIIVNYLGIVAIISYSLTIVSKRSVRYKASKNVLSHCFCLDISVSSRSSILRCIFWSWRQGLYACAMQSHVFKIFWKTWNRYQRQGESGYFSDQFQCLKYYLAFTPQMFIGWDLKGFQVNNCVLQPCGWVEYIRGISLNLTLSYGITDISAYFKFPLKV